MAQLRLNISGMNCAACQAHVQKALQKQPGVADAAVNLMTEEATVDYDPAAVTPETLVDAVRATGYGAELRAGNVYINRHITGAVVGRQPFGGFGMSGVGSKAGGPDYLHQFLDPRVITENTLRQGFTPETA